MSRSKATSWVVGTAVLGVLLLAAAWFLLVSPRMESAADLRFQAESEAARADQLEIQLLGLKADAENIETFRTELAELRVQMPSATALASLTRQLNDVAQQAGVFVSGVSPNTATAVEPPAAPVAAPPTETDAAAEETVDSETATTPPPVDPVAAAVQGLYAMPVEISIVGGYSQTLDFINRLQTTNPRLLLVTTFVATAPEPRAAERGLPAINPGDLETVISTIAYVLLDPTAVPVDAAGTPEALPVPGADTNPFQPAN